jgi:hypothetical protein
MKCHYNKIILSLCGLALALTGCAGPMVLERQVLGYDEVTSALDQKLLLLNIARVDRGRPIHFTATSSIAATFDWTTTIGLSGTLQETKGTDSLGLNLGASASENPTFSIIPISGEDFTERILTPFKDSVFEFLVFQGGAIDRVLRLLARGIEVQRPDGSFIRFIENNPARPKEYEEFRRIAMHLRWLSDNRHLFVRSLVFEETVVRDFKGVPRSEDIVKGSDKGLRWRQKPDGNYQLTRLQAGRVTVTNYDPMALTDQERFELNEQIKRNPKGFVYIHVRPDGPGGDLPIQGAIKLRSIQQMLYFISNGIRVAQEFAVTPDERTGSVSENPVSTLQINVTDSEPETWLASVRYGGKYYSINNTRWDRAIFAQLNRLFQTAVGDVEGAGLPITIAK